MGTRLRLLTTFATHFMFDKVQRGLFEQHKLLFSFMLAIATARAAGQVTEVRLCCWACAPLLLHPFVARVHLLVRIRPTLLCTSAIGLVIEACVCLCHRNCSTAESHVTEHVSSFVVIVAKHALPKDLCHACVWHCKHARNVIMNHKCNSFRSGETA